MPTGQWFRSDTQTLWFFDAGSVSIDFAYLGGFDASPAASPDAAGSGLTTAGFGPASGFSDPAYNGLLVPADLDDWLAERYPGIGTPTTDRELQDARALRDTIARLSIAAADGHLPRPEDIDTLNLFAATPDVPPSLGGGQRQAGAGRIRLGQAMSSLARDAVARFGEVGFTGALGSRIRRCASDDCRLVFFDESRAGSRRWCSMQKCGNRAKVRAHRARAAAGAAADTREKPSRPA